ncbi:hypothetical protein P9B03_08920 [Metasolibacillus meyeri]|uniref:Uncharacterized protein n=1 Tax=Metasolibacillus meyeri TaxID=1071052 RepID=A0AAW9NQJ7_9BACL|nr:hypothetical protein [Metasolibacillus meyeri]MEC1178602.1 hypothetical protein [Metasolibacillus meyeri]
MNWKNIKIAHIDCIEKCVAEFEITALKFFSEVCEDGIIHYGAFKVKIYERQSIHENGFTGVTNLRLADPLNKGGYEGGIGFGTSIEQALESTICNFTDNIKAYHAKKKTGLSKDDFVLLNYDEF